MRKNIWIFSLFCILSIIQIIAPVSMIVRRENTLRTGEQFKFKTVQVDLSTALRGRSIVLQFDAEKVPKPEGLTLHWNQKVYATIEADENGFARLKSLSLSLPVEKTFIMVKVRQMDAENVYLDLPFNRYYMEEEIAPKAEEAYRKQRPPEKHDEYVTVRVKSGDAVLEELYIKGIPIKEFIKKAL